MTILLSKGTPRDICDRCLSPSLPVAIFSDPDERESTLVLCVMCLAEAIDVPTGWNNVANVLQWLRRSDVSERFRNPLAQTKRGRPRKPAPVGERFHQEQQEKARAEPTDPAPLVPAAPVQPRRSPPRRRAGKSGPPQLEG